MDLLDFFGNALGGSQDPNDPNAMIARQMGADPAALRRAAAMQSLSAMGASMLANSGPSLQPHSFASALGQGLQAGQQTMNDSVGQQLNRLYVGENMKRSLAADKRQDQQDTQDQAWRTKFDDPDFVKNLSPTLQPYVSILRNMPVQQASQLMMQAGREDQAQAKLDAAAKKGELHYNQWGGATSAVPDDSAPGGFRITPLYGPQSAPAPRQDPGEMAKTIAAMRANGATPDEIHNFMVNGHSAPKEDAFDKKDEQTAVTEANRLQSSIPDMQDALRASDELIAGLTPDANGRIKFSGTGKLAAWKAAQPEGSLFGGQASLDPDLQVFAKLANRATLRDVPNLKTRMTNFELGFLSKANPNIANDPGTNLRIAQAMRAQQAQALANMQSKYKYINANRKLTGFTDFSGSGDDAGGGGAAAVQGGASSTAPASLPPGAQKLPDGRYYDPATNKIYRWQD